MTVRFPRSLIRHDGAERLLRALNVEIVEDLDDELAGEARQWLADVEAANGVLPSWMSIPSTAVRDALRSYEQRRRRDAA